jgi:hypothetical protein
LPALEDKPIVRSAPLFFEHEGSRAVRDGKWKLVSLAGDAWELYDLETDPTEMKNLIDQETARAKAMITAWEAWAKRCHVDTSVDWRNAGGRSAVQTTTAAANVATPQIANVPLTIRCDVIPEGRNGVILAQGGRQNGYALHLEQGRPVFTVRINGQVFEAKAVDALSGRFTLEARLERDGAMRLAVNSREVARGKASGLIPKQPQDELSIGEDSRTAVGNYSAPHPFTGKVENVKVVTE